MRRIRKASLLRSLFIGGLVFMGIIPAIIHNSSADSRYPDKRINQGEHLGGAVIYCQDEFGLSYNGNFNKGRIVVLQWNEETQSAEEVLSLSYDEYASVPVPGDPPGETLLAVGGGYELYLLSTGEFELRGTDEHGNEFAFRWPQCEPIINDAGPTLGPDTAPAPPQICQDGCDCCESSPD